MSLTWQQTTLLLRRLLLAMVLFMVARIFFYYFNIGLYSDISWSRLLVIFLIGIRFDLSAVIYFNLLFIVPQLIPLGRHMTNRYYQLVLRILFVSVNIALLAGNMADSIYFHFVQKRSTADVWKFLIMSDDVAVLLPMFIMDYWYVSVLVILMVWVVWKIYPMPQENKVVNALYLDRKRRTWVNVITKTITPLLILGLLLIGARGGLQLKPLNIMHASKSVSAREMPLVLNSIFTAMTTYGHDDLEPVNYMADEEANQVYPVLHRSGVQGRPSQKNVVILLLESFSKEYVGFLNDYKGFTPFLDSLSQHALVMKNAYSNGLRSIDAIPAVISGIPALMDDPFITSVYSNNKSISLAQILGSHGYSTAFFHGGTNGTMDFDAYAGYAGFDSYYGRREYHNDKDFDGFWGIYDEPFLQFVARQLNDMPEPFFAFEFTLSSHYPYHLPENRVSMFPEGELRIHRVVSYSDFALRRFFQTASQMPWYNNTLFIILADHPAQSVMVTDMQQVTSRNEQLTSEQLTFYKNTSGRYAIPMLFFAPGDSLLRGTFTGTAQQTDLPPTILQYLNEPAAMVAFGQSVLNSTAVRSAIQFVGGLRQVTSGKYSILFDGERVVSLFDNEADPAHDHNLLPTEKAVADSLETLLKAVVQQYTQRLISNRLSDTTGQATILPAWSGQ